MTSVPVVPGAIVFIDDAHTFGGTQVALAWIIHTVLSRTDIPVIVLCTEKTQRAIEEVVGCQSRVNFMITPSALPLNIVSFPLRISAYLRLLNQVRRQQTVRAWWLNLADIEFCLAPLMVLRAFGQRTHSYLHGTARFTSFHRRASRKRRALSWIRDLLAEHFVYRLHHFLVTPSKASAIEVRARNGRSGSVPIVHLYYPPIGSRAQLLQTPSVQQRAEGSNSINIWMIGGIAFGHKNNLMVLDVVNLLLHQGNDVRLTVAGTGPDMERFQMEAGRRELLDRITYLGWVTDPCDTAPRDAIVLIPSLHETMNIVAREAMRNGLRLVVSPIPVFYEWIPAHFIAADFSCAAFAAKLQEVCAIQAEEISETYGAALAQFSNDVFIEEFLRFTCL